PVHPPLGSPWPTRSRHRKWRLERGTEISTCCPSPTLFGLGLVPNNPEQISFTQEPLGIRRTSFSLVFRYSCQHSHFPSLHGWLTPPLRRLGNAPLPLRLREVRGFGSMLEPRYIVRARPLDQ